MPIREALSQTLTCPNPDNLWCLRAELLEAGCAPGGRALSVLGEYQRFLEQVRSGTTSRRYSELASKLDIGSISGVVMERFLEPQSARELTLSLIGGILSEGLMILGTRQHVRAWEAGLGSICAGAAWFLYEELWHWAKERKPDLPASQRRRLLDTLFRPVCSSETDGAGKSIIIGSLFQLLLASYVADEIAGMPG